MKERTRLKGEVNLSSGIFPIGLCGSWSVACPIQLGDLDQLSRGKVHLFIQHPATDSMAMKQIRKDLHSLRCLCSGSPQR